MSNDISAAEHPKKSVSVKGKTMTYMEMGEGDPIVFLHGNPTSSYLWRNIMPHLKNQGRCIAPDLIGMGDSEKLDNPGPDSYRFVEHRDYLDGILDALDVRQNVTLVIHDWGSALGFHYAMRHENNIKGMAFMEAAMRPAKWDDFPNDFRMGFRLFRTPGIGWLMISVMNMFVTKILPQAIVRKLSEEEKNYWGNTCLLYY